MGLAPLRPAMAGLMQARFAVGAPGGRWRSTKEEWRRCWILGWAGQRRAGAGGGAGTVRAGAESGARRPTMREVVHMLQQAKLPPPSLHASPRGAMPMPPAAAHVHVVQLP